MKLSKEIIDRLEYVEGDGIHRELYNDPETGKHYEVPLQLKRFFEDAEEIESDISLDQSFNEACKQVTLKKILSLDFGDYKKLNDDFVLYCYHDELLIEIIHKESWVEFACVVFDISADDGKKLHYEIEYDMHGEMRELEMQVKLS